jgi:hypothetical protein
MRASKRRLSEPEAPPRQATEVAAATADDRGRASETACADPPAGRSAADDRGRASATVDRLYQRRRHARRLKSQAATRRVCNGMHSSISQRDAPPTVEVEVEVERLRRPVRPCAACLCHRRCHTVPLGSQRAARRRVCLSRTESFEPLGDEWGLPGVAAVPSPSGGRDSHPSDCYGSEPTRTSRTWLPILL